MRPEYGTVRFKRDIIYFQELVFSCLLFFLASKENGQEMPDWYEDLDDENLASFREVSKFIIFMQND